MKIWLGDYAYDGGDAIKLLDYLAERETFYPVEIHTANPVGSSRGWHYNSCVLYFWSIKVGLAVKYDCQP